jgi:cytochrome P450
LAYNPFSPEVIADPYPYYAELRRESPVHLVEPFGFWAVSRYHDVVTVLKNNRTFSSAAMGGVTPGGGRTVINTDPPDHTRLRNLVNRAFTPRMVGDLQPRIQEVTDELLDAAAGGSAFDLVEDLAIPVPVIIIAEILGVDSARRHDFKRWSDNLVLGGIARSDAERAAIQTSMQEFRDYFSAAIDERRREPKDDLISSLVRAEENEALSADEVLAFTVLLLIAGNETTTNLISNAVLALLDHPDQLAKVQSDLSLVPNLVEEALRYDSPVQCLFRVTTKDVELAGTKIPRGARIMPLYASANRDERRYPDPDRFDVTRNAQGHLAFGYGAHFCLGAPLARLEARVVLETLIRRFSKIERSGGPVERIYSFLLRGLKHFPLSLSGQ